MTFILMLAVNLLVGVCVGLTGIAGFLLPMFYSGFLGYPSTISLALSFSAFLVSGVLGSVNYYRNGNLDVRTGCVLSLGSFLGAVFGVRLNLLIPETWIKTILYLVVLGSGISILLREHLSSVKASSKRMGREKTGYKTEAESAAARPHHGNVFYIILGIAAGAVCAASGAGGPVLVMPLLTMCGFPAHTAVGIALFDSIFIALPAALGYLKAAMAMRASISAPSVLTVTSALHALPFLLVFHGIGVYAGSRYAVRINQKLLKTIVAAASIVIACLKLSGF